MLTHNISDRRICFKRTGLHASSRRKFRLIARDDVDPERLGYVGHSLGATWGGALAGVEKRVKAFVLMSCSWGASGDCAS